MSNLHTKEWNHAAVAVQTMNTNPVLGGCSSYHDSKQPVHYCGTKRVELCSVHEYAVTHPSLDFHTSTFKSASLQSFENILSSLRLYLQLQSALGFLTLLQVSQMEKKITGTLHWSLKMCVHWKREPSYQAIKTYAVILGCIARESFVWVM